MGVMDEADRDHLLEFAAAGAIQNAAAKARLEHMQFGLAHCALRTHDILPSNSRLRSSSRYPHHPHAGERLTVVRRLAYAGDAHFVVELPDGVRLMLPAWMTEAYAATLPMMAAPRLSLACLRSCADWWNSRTYPRRRRMTQFAPVEATMEQRAQEQQLELLMLTAGEVTPPELFDSTTRTEIVNLLKALLGDRLSQVGTPAETDDD